MKYKSVGYTGRSALSTKRFILDRFLGCDFTQGDFITDYRRSPDALNLIWGTNQYIPKTRYGYKKIANFGSGNINGIHIFYGAGGAKTMLIHCGTSIWKETNDGFVQQSVTGLTDTPSRSFMFQSKLYIVGCGAMLQYDGTLLKVSDTYGTDALPTAHGIAYVPTVVMGRDPKVGGGNAVEEINLLTRRMKYSYSVPEKETITENTTSAASLAAYPANGTATHKKFTLPTSNFRNLTVEVEYTSSDGTLLISVIKDYEQFDADHHEYIYIPVSYFGVGTYIRTVFTYLEFDSNTDYLVEKGAKIIKVYRTDDAGVQHEVTKTDVTYGWNVNVDSNNVIKESSNGYLKFATAIPGNRGAEGMDNVLIEFDKPYETSGGSYVHPEDKINKCSIFDIYGGANDSRVFVSGNSTLKNCDWRSAVYDATYFTALGYTFVGSENVPIMGYVKQYDTQMIIKGSNQEDGSCWLRQMKYDANDMAYFPIEQGVTGTGAVSKNTFAILNGEPIFLSDIGVVGVEGTNVDYHNIIQQRSSLINKKLMKSKGGFESACAIVKDNKYHLFVGGSVFVCDARMLYKDEYGHRQYEWMVWESAKGISARSVAADDKYIYFGDSSVLYRFKTDYDTNPYLDDKSSTESASVVSYWTTPKLFFDTVSEKKTIYDMVAFFNGEERVNTKLSAEIDGRTISLGDVSRGDVLDFRKISFKRFIFRPITNFNEDTIKANLRDFICVKFRIETAPNDEAKSLAFGLEMLQADYIYTR